MRRIAVVFLMALVMTAFAKPSSAATIIFDECGTSDCRLLGHALVFEFDARQDGTGFPGGAVDVRFFGRPFGAGALGFNIAGSNVTISNLSAGFTFGGTNETLGRFGSFEFIIDAPDAGLSGLSFTVNRDGGFMDLQDVFAMNAAGYVGAAHVTNFFLPNLRELVGGTGDPFNNPTPVPEPGTMMLLATGLAAAWRARRRSI